MTAMTMLVLLPQNAQAEDTNNESPSERVPGQYLMAPYVL